MCMFLVGQLLLGCSSPSSDLGIHIPSMLYIYAWMTSKHYLARRWTEREQRSYLCLN